MKNQKNNIEYKGQLKGFPKAVVNSMLHYQELQGNKRDVSVFEKNIQALKYEKGFSWTETLATYDFWDNVISDRDFELFFEKYPDGCTSIEQAEKIARAKEEQTLNIDFSKEISFKSQYGRGPVTSESIIYPELDYFKFVALTSNMVEREEKELQYRVKLVFSHVTYERVCVISSGYNIYISNSVHDFVQIEDVITGEITSYECVGGGGKPIDRKYSDQILETIFQKKHELKSNNR